jgi:predicted Holliday junction resolvase-like endonuclease
MCYAQERFLSSFWNEHMEFLFFLIVIAILAGVIIWQDIKIRDLKSSLEFTKERFDRLSSFATYHYAIRKGIDVLAASKTVSSFLDDKGTME